MSVQIDDAFGFYQGPLVTVTKSLVSQGYMTKEQHDEIVKNKEEHDRFHEVPFDQIKHCCNEELIALSKALTVLRDGVDRMGIRLKSWSGAGSGASALIRKEKLQKKHYSPDIAVKD
jgi:hypothetical protein